MPKSRVGKPITLDKCPITLYCHIPEDTADTFTGCAVVQHCYNSDVSFLSEKMETLTPVKSKPLNRLTHNLLRLITSRDERLFQIW